MRQQCDECSVIKASLAQTERERDELRADRDRWRQCYNDICAPDQIAYEGLLAELTELRARVERLSGALKAGCSCRPGGGTCACCRTLGAVK